MNLLPPQTIEFGAVFYDRGNCVPSIIKTLRGDDLFAWLIPTHIFSPDMGRGLAYAVCRTENIKKIGE